LGNLEALGAAVGRIAASYELEIFDLQFRRESIGWVLRVIVDRAAGHEDRPDATGGASRDVVSIDDCRRVSEDLSALLDVEPGLLEHAGASFTLEVSSPGLDRPLRGEADYRRFLGRLAKIVTREPVGGQSHFAGRLTGVEDGAVLLVEGKRTHRVPLSAISRARLEVEF
jgi:ribosome maturation factor RimP